LYASYYWRLASGGAVVLATVILFVVGVCVSSIVGSLARRPVATGYAVA
jgi:hypothetical protein